MTNKNNFSEGTQRNFDYEVDRSFSPSEKFAKFMTLAQEAQILAAKGSTDDQEWAQLHDKLDLIAAEIARRRATSIPELFEKLYVWRRECFSPSETGGVYFDDIFPLSAYYDLKRLAGADDINVETDNDLLHELENWGLETSARNLRG